MRSVTRQGYGMCGAPRAPLFIVVRDHMLGPDPDYHPLLAGPFAERLAGVLDRKFLDERGRRVVGQLCVTADLRVPVAVRSVGDQHADAPVGLQVHGLAPPPDRREE